MGHWHTFECGSRYQLPGQEVLGLLLLGAFPGSPILRNFDVIMKCTFNVYHKRKLISLSVTEADSAMETDSAFETRFSFEGKFCVVRVRKCSITSAFFLQIHRPEHRLEWCEEIPNSLNSYLLLSVQLRSGSCFGFQSRNLRTDSEPLPLSSPMSSGNNMWE